MKDLFKKKKKLSEFRKAMQKTVDEMLVRIWGVLKMREFLDGGTVVTKRRRKR